MPSILSTLSEKIRARIPERHVCLAPGHVFFSAAFDVPHEVDSAALADFAELSLESVSPFPIDQLAWGFLHHPRSRRVLCYGTPLSRLASLGFDDLDTCFQAFPGFIAVFGSVPERPVTVLVHHGASLSALLFDAGDPVPRKVISIAAGADDLVTDQAILAERETLLKRLPADAPPPEDAVHVAEGCTIDGSGRITFRLRHLQPKTADGDAPETLNTLPRDPGFIWGADLRDRAFAATQRRNRAFSAKLWRTTQAAGIFLALLILFQLANWGTSAWIGLLEARIRRQAPVANAIQNQMDLADRLAQSANEDIRPIDMLTAVNDTRPAAVYFTRASSNRFDALRVEGRASNVQAVNDYVRSLEAKDYVGAVENNPQTRGGETEFEMLVRFNSIPLAPPPPAAPDESEDEVSEGGAQ